MHTGPGVRAEALTIPDTYLKPYLARSDMLIGDSVLYHSLRWMAHFDTSGCDFGNYFVCSGERPHRNGKNAELGIFSVSCSEA